MFRSFSTLFSVCCIAVTVSGCASFSTGPRLSQSKHVATTTRGSHPDSLDAFLAAKGLTRSAPILIRIFKEDHQLEVWKMGASGRFQMLKSYPICTFSGSLGPKRQEGDRQAPEGFYDVSREQMNPNSRYRVSFNLGFPNAFDRANGRTGKFLMVHGRCSSVGCYAMGDDQITEIYALADAALGAGQSAFQVQAFPFRMTEANLQRYASNPNIAFWRTLKKGSDIFEKTGRAPHVSVVGKNYQFS